MMTPLTPLEWECYTTEMQTQQSRLFTRGLWAFVNRLLLSREYCPRCNRVTRWKDTSRSGYDPCDTCQSCGLEHGIYTRDSRSDIPCVNPGKNYDLNILLALVNAGLGKRVTPWGSGDERISALTRWQETHGVSCGYNQGVTAVPVCGVVLQGGQWVVHQGPSVLALAGTQWDALELAMLNSLPPEIPGEVSPVESPVCGKCGGCPSKPEVLGAGVRKIPCYCRDCFHVDTCLSLTPGNCAGKVTIKPC